MVCLRFLRFLYYWRRIYCILQPDWVQRSSGVRLWRYSYWYALPWLHKVDDDWAQDKRQYQEVNHSK